MFSSWIHRDVEIEFMEEITRSRWSIGNIAMNFHGYARRGRKRDIRGESAACGSSEDESQRNRPMIPVARAMALVLSKMKIIFAVVFPPLGVFLERGCGADLLINILLTILGYIPGIIHALYIILKY
ncbi:hypothetical protein NP233_g9906 [Leucocoprinus birnbaumii]|uniref:Plasma membrane proteolipid 3 n=1 Tax=Leucocoprinus birnbaumii TaxID=56174 RepID=A0AAD5VK02_9AGAR|nr:hypothetical protein NP233_g9906 [Leucocoprinus birnbaumii]